MTDAFEVLEDEFRPFDVRVNGVPVWELVRFQIHREILRQNGFGQGHETLNRGAGDHVRGLYQWVRNWVVRNPFLADPADVMFVGHPRRKKQEDGLWWDLYCDPVHEGCDLDSVHFEKSYLLGHCRPAKTDGLRYLDLIQLGGAIQARAWGRDVSIPAAEAAELRDVKREISERMNATVDVEGRVVEVLRGRRLRRWLYEKLLERVSPEVVVLVVSYGNETIIEACQAAGVPTVELQHGVVHPYHLGYHFRGDRRKQFFPDYLLTWGQYWSDRAEYPIPDDAVVPVGYPYLEREREKYEAVVPGNQIVVLSQGEVGEKLTRFAMGLDEALPDFEVVYKLHPGEYGRWRTAYPWLTDSSLTVVDDDSIPLYRLFAESSAQVGVSSTTIFEGLSFGLQTFLVELPTIEVTRDLIERKHVEVVRTVDEVRRALQGAPPRAQPRYEDVFEPGAVHNISRVLERFQT